MKHLLFAVAFTMCLPLYAQDDGYEMYQVIRLKAKDGQGQQLNAGIKAHNDKYHQEGAEAVNVWAVRTGPRTGSLLWSKGPRTWSDMDHPIEGDDHLDDWRAQVVPHAHLGEWEFWRLLNNASYQPDGLAPKIAVVRYYDIKPDKWGNAVDICQSIVKIYEENSFDIGFQIFTNQANAGDGRDWAIIWFHENWSSLDKGRNFFGLYDEKHGIDRREYFERWNEAAGYTGMEIFELLTELSVAGSD